MHIGRVHPIATMTMFTIESLEERIHTARDAALLRFEALENNGRGVAEYFVPVLQKAFDSWRDSCDSSSIVTTEEKKDDEHNALTTFHIHNSRETDKLRRILSLHATLSSFDPTLSEELGKQGSHIILSKLIRLDACSWELEEDQDALIELQDLAAQSMSGAPQKFAPYTVEDLKDRLPLSFKIDSVLAHEQLSEVILIRQVTERQSAQEDVGFVMWPSAVALSRWLISNKQIVEDRSVLEIGAGCGLVGLLAARLQNKGSTTLTDFNPTVIRNLATNIALNGVKAKAAKLDFYEQTGESGGWLDGDHERQSQVDLILAADMICQPADAVAAANTIHDALSEEGEAIVICGDSKHRFGVDHFEAECKRVELTVQTSNVADIYDGKLLTENMNKTAGYVEGMSLTMFRITK